MFPLYRRTFLGLEEALNNGFRNFYSVRAEYILSSNGSATKLAMEYSSKTNPPERQVQKEVKVSDRDRFPKGEVAYFCLKLNLTAKTYQVSIFSFQQIFKMHKNRCAVLLNLLIDPFKRAL